MFSHVHILWCVCVCFHMCIYLVVLCVCVDTQTVWRVSAVWAAEMACGGELVEPAVWRGQHGVERKTDIGLCHVMKSPFSTARSLSQSDSSDSCVVGVMRTVAKGGRVHTTTLRSSGSKAWEEVCRDHGPLLQILEEVCRDHGPLLQDSPSRSPSGTKYGCCDSRGSLTHNFFSILRSTVSAIFSFFDFPILIRNFRILEFLSPNERGGVISR